MKDKIIILLIILSLSSCRSRKTTVETHSTDTIYKSEIIKIDKPQLNTIVLDNICDSLGILNPIFYTYTSDNVKTTLKSEHNTLKLDINIDSIVNSKVNEYKSSLKTSDKVEIIYKTPSWAWKFIFISGSLNLLLLGWIFKRPLLKLITGI